MQLLSEIKTPLALLALVVLVTEAILLILANKATGLDFTLLVIAMPLLLIGVLAVVFFLLLTKPGALGAGAAEEVAEIRHDVFLAAPMASHADDAAYQKDRAEMNSLVAVLEKDCGYDSVFYAGKHIASGKKFEAADISVREDYEALRSSRRFILVYPGRLVSSVLVEAGMAIALHKPMLIFARDRDELPFLLKEAEQAFPRQVKIYQYETPEDIRSKFQTHRDDLFARPNNKA